MSKSNLAHFFIPGAVVLIIFMSGCLGEDPLIQEAVDKGDPSICLQIEHSRDEKLCYRRVAASLNDPSVCNSYLSETNDQDQCISHVAVEHDNPDGCGLLSTSDSTDLCVQRIAENTEDSSLCVRIARDSYKDSCYKDIALSTENPSLCENVENANTQDGCYISIAQSTRDPSSCGLVESDSRKDSCYNAIAQSTEDSEICNSISDNDMSLLCYGRVAGDSSVCEGISSQNKRDDCYSSAGIKSSDSSACAMVEAQSRRDSCYFTLGEQLGDESLCDQIGTPNTQENCLVRVARVTGDQSLCNRITDDYRREVCIRDTGGALQNESQPSEDGIEGCTYDSECPAICEGTTMWKQGCNPRTGECIKTFDYDCTAQIETIAGSSFGKTCSTGACVRDVASIESRRNELILKDEGLSQDALGLQDNVQTLRNGQITARENCLSALSDVTNLFIINSALLLGNTLTSVPDSLLSVGTSNALGIVDKLASDPSRMSPEEVISLNCNLVNSLEVDIGVVDKKIEMINDERRTIQQQIEELNAALQ